MIHNRDFALCSPFQAETTDASKDTPPPRMKAVAMSEGGNTTGVLLLPSTTEVAVNDPSCSGPTSWVKNPSATDTYASKSGQNPTFTPSSFLETSNPAQQGGSERTVGHVHVGVSNFDAKSGSHAYSGQTKVESFFSAASDEPSMMHDAKHAD
jgi:hypothetical protein